MQHLLEYLAVMPSSHKLLWLIACLSIASVVELLIPLFRAPYNRWQHFKPNAVLLVSTLIINSIFALVLVSAIPWFEQNQIGLLYWVDLPIWLEFVIALVFLDLLAQYTIHYLLHQVPLLWRFHMVHHSDTHVDATTGTRHHPMDYLSRETFSFVTIMVLGISIEFYILYRLITMFCTYLTHANICFPDWLDRALSNVIVTPKAHKFHHHFEAPWTDSNYGNIFVFWDKLFGTYVYDSVDKIQYGVDIMNDDKADSVAYQLKAPFLNKSVLAD